MASRAGSSTQNPKDNFYIPSLPNATNGQVTAQQNAAPRSSRKRPYIAPTPILTTTSSLPAVAPANISNEFILRRLGATEERQQRQELEIKNLQTAMQERVQVLEQEIINLKAKNGYLLEQLTLLSDVGRCVENLNDKLEELVSRVENLVRREFGVTPLNQLAETSLITANEQRSNQQQREFIPSRVQPARAEPPPKRAKSNPKLATTPIKQAVPDQHAKAIETGPAMPQITFTVSPMNQPLSRQDSIPSDLTPELNCAIFIQEASNKLMECNPVEALRLVSEVLIVKPYDIGALRLKEQALKLCGRPEEFKQELSKFIKIIDSYAYNDRYDEEGLKIANALLEFPPESLSAVRYKVHALCQMNEHDQALNFINLHLQFCNSESAQKWLLKQKAFVLLELDLIQDAMNIINSFSEKKDKDLHIDMLTTLSYFKLSDKSTAMKRTLQIDASSLTADLIPLYNKLRELNRRANVQQTTDNFFAFLKPHFPSKDL